MYALSMEYLGSINIHHSETINNALFIIKEDILNNAAIAKCLNLRFLSIRDKKIAENVLCYFAYYFSNGTTTPPIHLKKKILCNLPS